MYRMFWTRTTSKVYLAVVKGNADAVGDIETGSWGVKTEDAVAVDSKVSFILILPAS